MVQKKLLTNEQCNEIISLGDGSWYASAVKERETIIYYRNSKSADLKIKKDDWLYKILKTFFIENGFEITSDHIKFVQLIKYDVGDYIRKHRDSHQSTSGGPVAERVAACVILLNDEFEGGTFYAYPPEGTVELEKVTGQVVTFKTDVIHEVLPVTKGVRYSLAVFLTSDEVKMNTTLI